MFEDDRKDVYFGSSYPSYSTPNLFSQILQDGRKRSCRGHSMHYRLLLLQEGIQRERVKNEVVLSL